MTEALKEDEKWYTKWYIYTSIIIVLFILLLLLIYYLLNSFCKKKPAKIIDMKSTPTEKNCIT